MTDAEKILLQLAADNEHVCVICSDVGGTSHRVAWKLHADGLLEYDYTHKTEPRAFFKITPKGHREINASMRTANMTDHTEMQIPDDVMEAARKAAVYISGGSLRENTRLIAEAILAERGRCARIAEDRATAYEGFYDSTSFKSECLAVVAALARVAAKIRHVDK